MNVGYGQVQIFDSRDTQSICRCLHDLFYNYLLNNGYNTNYATQLAGIFGQNISSVYNGFVNYWNGSWGRYSQSVGSIPMQAIGDYLYSIANNAVQMANNTLQSMQAPPQYPMNAQMQPTYPAPVFSQIPQDQSGAAAGWSDMVQTKQNSRIQQQQTQEQQRAKNAAIGRDILQNQLNAMGTNASTNQPVSVPRTGADADLTGISVNADYAIIGNVEKNPQIPVLNWRKENVEQEQIDRSIYNCAKKMVITSKSDGTTILANSYEVYGATRSAANAFKIVQYLDPTVVKAQYFAHVLKYNFVEIYSCLPGIAKEFNCTNEKIVQELNKVPRDSKNAFDKLRVVMEVISNADEFVRKQYKTFIVNKWNTLARCLFADPAFPHQYLKIDDASNIFTFQDNHAQVSQLFNKLSRNYNEIYFKRDSRTDVINEITYSMSDKINHIVDHLVNWMFNGGQGFGKINSKTVKYLSLFEELPIVIDHSKRVYDLPNMTQEQIDALINEFNNNWIFFQERRQAIITNLPIGQFARHHTTTLVSARDNPVINSLRIVLGQQDWYHELYKYDSGHSSYVANISGNRNNEIMFVR